MSDAPERTHYADDETLAYIAELEKKVVALEQGMAFVDEKNTRLKAEVERLRAAIREIAEAAHIDDDLRIIEICRRALTKPEGE